MLYKEIITVYSETHVKPINKLRGQKEVLLIIQEGGTGFKELIEFRI